MGDGAVRLFKVSLFRGRKKKREYEGGWCFTRQSFGLLAFAERIFGGCGKEVVEEEAVKRQPRTSRDAFVNHTTQGNSQKGKMPKGVG